MAIYRTIHYHTNLLIVFFDSFESLPFSEVKMAEVSATDRPGLLHSVGSYQTELMRFSFSSTDLHSAIRRLRQVINFYVWHFLFLTTQHGRRRRRRGHWSLDPQHYMTNILGDTLGYVPGIIHAIWYIWYGFSSWC